jgi:hypothetical protein
MKKEDTYVLKKVIEFPGMTARIYSPVLTEEEQARRMQQIYKAAAALLER